MKETVPDKAQRLSRGEIREVDARVFWVPGDTPGSLYLVVIGHEARYCSCKHGQQAVAQNFTPKCSHIIAAIQYKVREFVPDDVFSGIGAHGGKR